MSSQKEFNIEDLDFYLTIIVLFCEYNQSLHYSDKMFADITSDIIKRELILNKLSDDGFITIEQNPTIRYRFKIDVTPKGIKFQKEGGYKNKNFQERKTAWLSIFKSGWFRLLEIIVSGLVGSAINQLIHNYIM